jgi:hypothetical protein
MLGTLVSAMIGERLAGRNRGARGAMIGAGAAALGRRGLGPLATAVALGWGAKKLYNWNRERRGRPARYPSSDASVSPPSGGRS